MTTTRDLIQRLADALAEWQLGGAPPENTSDVDLITEARAYLAQPEPEEPTDEEILNLSQEHQVSYTMCDGDVIYPLQAGADMKDDVLSFARALIAADRARWLLAAIKPVPVSKRLPGPEDCMDEGWAWFYTSRGHWITAVLPVSPACTHWLPHYALPIPTSTETR